MSLPEVILLVSDFYGCAPVIDRSAPATVCTVSVLVDIVDTHSGLCSNTREKHSLTINKRQVRGKLVLNRCHGLSLPMNQVCK